MCKLQCKAAYLQSVVWCVWCVAARRSSRRVLPPWCRGSELGPKYTTAAARGRGQGLPATSLGLALPGSSVQSIYMQIV